MIDARKIAIGIMILLAMVLSVSIAYRINVFYVKIPEEKCENWCFTNATSRSPNSSSVVFTPTGKYTIDNGICCCQNLNDKKYYCEDLK